MSIPDPDLPYPFNLLSELVLSPSPWRRRRMPPIQDDDFDHSVVQQVFAAFGDQARVTCISCPLQVEGSWGSRVFYFRARHGRWTLGLGLDDDAAVGASMSQFAPYPITDPEQIWADNPEPLSSHGSPEPDYQVDAGTFGLWLRQQLELASNS